MNATCLAHPWLAPIMLERLASASGRGPPEPPDTLKSPARLARATSMVDIEIRPVGGYSDFGRNMTCVRVGREAVILDMGIRLDRILLDEENVLDEMHPVDLQRLGAIPDDSVLKDLGAKVVAIVIGHAHLDHVGAVPKLASHFPDAPIYGTPYTIRFIENQVTQFQKGGKKRRLIPNRLVELPTGQMQDLSKAIRLELVHVTHSIVQ